MYLYEWPIPECLPKSRAVNYITPFICFKLTAYNWILSIFDFEHVNEHVAKKRVKQALNQTTRLEMLHFTIMAETQTLQNAKQNYS